MTVLETPLVDALQEAQKVHVKELSELKAANLKATKLAEDLQGELGAAKSRLLNKEEELNTLGKQLEEAHAANEDSSTAAEDAKIEATRVAEDLQAQLNAAKSRLSDKDQELERLDKKLEKAEGEVVRDFSRAEAAEVDVSKMAKELKAQKREAAISLAAKDRELKQLAKQLKTLKQKRDRLSGLKAEAMKELAQLKGCLPAADCQGSVVLEDVNAAEDMVSVVSEAPDAAQELGSVHDMKEDVEQALSPRSTTSSARIPAARLEESEDHDAVQCLPSLQDVKKDVEEALSPRSTTSSPRIPAGRPEESDLESEAGSGSEGSKDGSSGEGCSTATPDDAGFQVVSHQRDRRPRRQQGRQQHRRRAGARQEAGRVLEVARPTPARAAAVPALAGSTVEKKTSTGATVLEVSRPRHRQQTGSC